MLKEVLLRVIYSNAELPNTKDTQDPKIIQDILMF